MVVGSRLGGATRIVCVAALMLFQAGGAPLAAGAQAATTFKHKKGDHPRLWVGDGRLAKIARRCAPGGSMHAQYVALKNKVAAELASGRTRLWGAKIVAVGLCHLVEKHHGRNVEPYLRGLKSVVGTENPQLDRGRVWQYATAVDWAWNDLTAEEETIRRSVQWLDTYFEKYWKPLWDTIETFPEGWHYFLGRHRGCHPYCPLAWDEATGRFPNLVKARLLASLPRTALLAQTPWSEVLTDIWIGDGASCTCARSGAIPRPCSQPTGRDPTSPGTSTTRRATS